MIVTMLTTAASSAWILHAGQTYNLPTSLAKSFLAGTGPHGQAYARLAAPNAKVTRIPPQPDLGDVPDAPDEEDLTEEDDGD